MWVLQSLALFHKRNISCLILKKKTCRYIFIYYYYHYYYYYEFAQAIMKVGKSKICSADQQAGDPGDQMV